MTSEYTRYRAADDALPDEVWAWNLHGAGEENMGKDGEPELLPIDRPNADQMLVRIDSVGLCFSDVKIMRQGGSHPARPENSDSAHNTSVGYVRLHLSTSAEYLEKAVVESPPSDRYCTFETCDPCLPRD